MNNKNTKLERIIVDTILSFCVFLVPAIFTLTIAFAFSFRYKKYIEFPIFAYIVDVLYKPTGNAIIGLFGISVIVILIVEFLRERLKSKSKDTL